jgi:hypothetical protein
MSAESFMSVKVKVLNKVLCSDTLKERVIEYVNNVYVDNETNKNIRKSFAQQLLAIMEAEHYMLKRNIGVYYVKDWNKIKRRKKEYKATPYVEFCREMKAKYTPAQLLGKTQALWRARRNKNEKEFERLIALPSMVKEGENTEYTKNALRFEMGNIQEKKEEIKLLNEDTSSDEEDDPHV